MAALVAKHRSTENQSNNNYMSKDRNLKYLDYEDFGHVGLGYETYSDGVQHPLELRKILTGELSKEMSVKFKLSDEDTFKDLVHPCRELSPDITNDSESCLEITETKSLAPTVGTMKRVSLASRYQSSSPPDLLPRPPKLIKAGGTTASSISTPSMLTSMSSFTSTPSPFLGGLWDTDPATSVGVDPTVQTDYDDLNSIVNNRRPGRPAGNQGTFDPESGTIRYLCRLECGASLASAKGRRKHEKKHCPNMPKDQNLLGGVGGVTNLYPGNPLMGHSLFSRVPLKQRDSFECRICGKVLKTYEGRRLHEKLQHKPKSYGPKKDNESLDSVELEDGEVVGSYMEEEHDYMDEDLEGGVEEVDPVIDDDDE